MKKVWVDIRPWDKEAAIAALEGGADAVIVPEKCSPKVRELGRIATVAPDGDVRLGEQAVEITLASKEDEERAASSPAPTVILSSKDWTIIPLENLIAAREGLMVCVTNSDEAVTMVGVLEKGASGVVIPGTDVNEIRKTVERVHALSPVLKLVKARIIATKTLGMGDRVCIDTCTNMRMGEGMLVGNSSGALFLVHSESVDNPYVAARPFRVNAGGVHAYVVAPGGKTRYLSELSAGDSVLVVNALGETQEAIVGRAKIEKRPMMLIEAEVGKEPVSLVLQNAETIRLTSPDGKPRSVVSLKEGDEVLACLQNAGRHFGMAVEETITEK